MLLINMPILSPMIRKIKILHLISYIVLTSTCGRHVPVNKPKRKICIGTFVCIFVQKQFKYFSTILPLSQQI